MTTEENALPPDSIKVILAAADEEIANLRADARDGTRRVLEGLQWVLAAKCKIEAIKGIRMAAGITLKEAKEFYEAHSREHARQTSLAEMEDRFAKSEHARREAEDRIAILEEQRDQLAKCLKDEEELTDRRIEVLDSYRVVLRDVAVQAEERNLQV